MRVLPILTALLIAASAIAFSLMVGAAGISRDPRIVFDLRMPRALLAGLAGGGLAVSGAAFQAMLRNPLAEPYILGVSGGAALGAVTVTVFTRSAILLPVAALLGALLTIALVFAIATRATLRLDPRVLLLAGVIVGAFFQAIILLLLTFADVESFRSAIFWMMGSVAGASWKNVLTLTAIVLPASFALFGLARPLNLLTSGEETALYLGVNVTTVMRLAYFIASLLVAVTVATCGSIGFVGLVVPHAVRMLWGSDHRIVIPAAFFVGSAFLILADTTARTIVAPAELPVGVITALVGVPVFVLLLMRRAS
ncbi:MAG TPA: iron ABC transporter permease [Longimicrobiales bacterium]